MLYFAEIESRAMLYGGDVNDLEQTGASIHDGLVGLETDGVKWLRPVISDRQTTKKLDGGTSDGAPIWPMVMSRRPAPASFSWGEPETRPDLLPLLLGTFPESVRADPSSRPKDGLSTVRMNCRSPTRPPPSPTRRPPSLLLPEPPRRWSRPPLLPCCR